MRVKRALAFFVAILLLTGPMLTSVGASTTQNTVVVPSDMIPIKQYLAYIGGAYYLPAELKMVGDSFTSSDPKLMTVDSNGQFTAKAAGTAYIVITNTVGSRYIKLTIHPPSPVSAVAAQSQTWEDRINALTLNPFDSKEVTDADAMAMYNKYTNMAESAKTNYELLRAVYDDIVNNYRTETLKRWNMPNYSAPLQCTGYALELCKALRIVGFDVRHMRGECTMVGGGWTVHSWSAIMVGEDLLYFDATIPSEYR